MRDLGRRLLVAPLGLIVATLAGQAVLRAQDVSHAPVQWADPRGAPDELPIVKSRFSGTFPEELKGTTDVGYVFFEAVLDEKGRPLMMHPHASSPALERVVLRDRQDWKFTPGKRAGKGVNTHVTFAVLFNPASAGSKAATATPRLLEVDIVRMPRPKGIGPRVAIPDRIVYADLAVDETGKVIAVKNAPEELAEAMTIAAKNWQFAPARREGNAVAAEVHAPFVVVTARPVEEGKPTPPRVTFQARPIYPFAMRASGMRGEVVVDFIVDIEGRVRNAYAVRSLNPSFDDPAIEAVQKWRFEPARLGDRPVNVHMQVPIIFTLDGTRDGGSDGIEMTSKPDMASLPEELRYDTAPRIRGMVRPIYPYAALSTGREGHAVVHYLVTADGRIAEARVREASAPEFGRALLAAVEQFRYEPALKKGRPTMAFLAFKQEFRRDERYQMVSVNDLDLLHREQKKPTTIVTLRDLDRKLRPVSQRPPHFPMSEQPVQNAEATIEFLVDEDGRARLPRVVAATSEAFGEAAALGVASWRFDPPTRGGRPVVVRVQVPIGFILDDADSPASKK